jgi:hypothetical protein
MVLIAPVIAVILVVGAYVYMRGQAPTPRAAPLRPAPTAVSPSLGPWKHIASRADDPQPLTLAELFPARVTAVTAASTRVAQRSGSACTHAVIGAALRAAVRKGGCTQVMRASYLSANRKMMATVGVLNLADYADAARAGHATGSSQFIRQLPGAHGPTRNLAKGTGLELAEVKGHYLILIWSEFANLQSPAGKRHRFELEQFSAGLISDTVNVSLTSRMVTGHPSPAP